MHRARYERSADFGVLPLARDWLALISRHEGLPATQLLSGLARLHLGDWSQPADDEAIAATVRIHRNSRALHLRRNPSDFHTFAEVMLRDAYGPLIHGLDFKPRTWVDIGAHIGLATLYVSAYFPDFRGVCLEPIAESAHLLRHNLVSNGLNARVEQGAVAANDGSTTIFKTAWWSSCSTSPEVRDARLKNVRRPENTHRLGDETVSAISVESLLERHNLDSVDLLKFDAEGAESVVFERAAAWLKRVRRIGIELHARYIDAERVRRKLYEAGFRQRAQVGSLSIFDRTRYA